MQNDNKISVLLRSRPARGGWIEMTAIELYGSYEAVPPRKGRVD